MKYCKQCGKPLPKGHWCFCDEACNLEFYAPIRAEITRQWRMAQKVMARKDAKKCKKCGAHFYVPITKSLNMKYCTRHKLPKFVPVERACKVCETKFTQKKRGRWACCSESCRKVRHNEFSRLYEERKRAEDKANGLT